MKLLYEKRSAQKLIQVFEEDGRRLLLLEGRGEIHSEWDPKKPMLSPAHEHYWNLMTFFTLSHATAKDVLIVGLGAGTCARQLLMYRPELNIDGIEIDTEVTDIAKQFFGLDELRVKIHHEDAIAHLTASKKKYDVIIVDAFIKGNLGIQFTTPEFYALVKKHLSRGGLVIINYLCEKDWQPRLRSAVHEHFKSCRQVGIPTTYNYVAIVSDTEFDISSVPGLDDDIKRLKNFILEHIESL